LDLEIEFSKQLVRKVQGLNEAFLLLSQCIECTEWIESPGQMNTLYKW
jgi:hypothetical protein